VPIPFSELPGRHERHYRRKIGNPLYGSSAVVVNDADLLEAQRRDHEELVAFIMHLRDLVQRAVDLKPNEESQVVLDLKTELDRSYERASALTEDQSGNKDAIRQLTAIIMATIRRASAGDPVAERELDDEDEARRQHYRLLEQPLVADLLAPDTPIGPGELAPTLLSETEPAVKAAIELFDGAQLETLCHEARAILSQCGELPASVQEAPARLAFLEGRLGAE